MLAEEYRFLKRISYKKFHIWDCKQLLSSATYSSKYELQTFNSVLKKANIEWVKIEDEVEYPILGVRSYGQGVYLNRVALGKELTMKNYQKSKINHLFWCKVRTVRGQFGVVTEDYENTFASSNMEYMEIDLEKIIPSYLELLFQKNQLTDYMDTLAIGADGRHFNKSALLKVSIPLPTTTEQKNIVNQYNITFAQAEECETKAKKLEESIDKILFEDLGIEIQIQDSDKSDFCFLKFVHYKNLIQWSVKKNTLKNNPSSMFNSRKYENKPLSSVAEINPTTSFDSLGVEDIITFLPMECISDIYGEIITRYDGEKNKSKGYTRFKEQDILWAKITPCMQNGKCAIATNLVNKFGYGSTEYHVVRANNKIIQTEYLYHFLRTKTIREVAQSFFTGSAGQQRVSADFLEILSLPIPSLDIQQEISQKITKIKTEIKELRQTAESLRIKAKSDFEREVFSE